MKKAIIIAVVLVFTLISSSILIFALSNTNNNFDNENAIDNEEIGKDLPENEIIINGRFELDESLYPRLNEKQLKEIENFKEKHSLSYPGRCPRQEALITGKIDKNEKRITLKEIKDAISNKLNISELVKHPDFVANINIGWTEYWLDDNAYERIVLSYASTIVYVKLDEKGEIIETYDLYSKLDKNAPSTTTQPQSENTFSQ